MAGPRITATDTLTLPAGGERSITLTATIHPDDSDSTDETVIFTLAATTPPSPTAWGALGPRTTYTLYITDNDSSPSPMPSPSPSPSPTPSSGNGGTPSPSPSPAAPGSSSASGSNPRGASLLLPPPTP